MSIPYVCQTCRRHSVGSFYRTTSQLHAKATFVSLNNSRTTRGQSTSEQATGQTRRPKAVLLDIAEDDGRQIPFVKKKKKRQSLWGPRTAAEDTLESLFEESLKPTSNVTPSSKASAKAPSPEAYARVELLLHKLSSDDVTLAESWALFVEKLGPDVWKGLDQQIVFPDTLNHVSTLLLRKILAAQQDDIVPKGVPNLSEVAKVYMGVGIMRPRFWMSMIWLLIKKLLHQRSLYEGATSAGESLGIDEKPIDDFLGIWRLYSAVGNPEHWTSLDEAATHGFEFLPPLNTKDLHTAKDAGGLDNAFAKLYHAHSPDHRKGLAAASILSFDILTTFAPPEGVRFQGGDKFVSALAGVIGLSRMTTAEFEECFKPTFYAEWTKNYKPDLPVILKRSRELIKNTRGVISDFNEYRRIGRSNINKRLDSATKARDMEQIHELWAEAACMSPITTVKAQESGEDSTPTNFGLTQHLCNHFILSYTTLRQPERAVQVWNHMIRVGLTPGLLTWNAMLEGCKAARDSKSLDAVWMKLLSSGSIPDVPCWTTRINCLIDSGRIDDGFRALDDMGKMWLKAARRKHKITKDTDLSKIDTVDGYPKPTIATVNAAISALARRKRMDPVPRLLAWAGTLGISPDIYTYNILLRPLIREGRSEDAQKLLKTMQAAGIQADVATFTTILDETFRSDVPYTAAEQTAIVADVFNEMEASGVKANLHTYSTIIYIMLKSSGEDGDMSAVRAVLRRMTDNRIQPSAHIYTMLVEHYLTRDPPDLDAARALVETVKLGRTPVDHIFWDRVIEGFSRVLDTNTALTVLGKQEKQGHQVGWYSMAVLIQALLANGEREMAKRVLSDVRADRGGPLGKDEKGKEGQHLFWDIMAENGLVDPSEVNI